MENPNLRLFSRAQRRALRKGVMQGKRVRDFESLLKEEIEKLKRGDDGRLNNSNRDNIFYISAL